MPPTQWCFLPLVGVLTEFRNQGIGQSLLTEAWRQSNMIPNSSGIVLGSGAAQAADFYFKLGFQKAGELSFEGTVESLFFRPKRP